MAALVLNEEQQMLRDAASRFFAESAPVSQLRALRDNREASGFSADLWQSMVEMGFVGTLIPQAFSGAEFGHVGMGQVFEQIGRNLSAAPLFSSAVLGASTILLGGSEEQKQALLPAIAEGRLLLALAVDEKPRHAPWRVSTVAQSTDEGFVLTGRKSFVIDGHVANKLIVSARTGVGDSDQEGITLLLVDPASEGVSIERTVMVDSRNAAIIHFDHVKLGAEAVLGEVDQGFAVLERVLDIANAHVAAELLGIAQEAFGRTVAYLQERKQFGVLIGSFQALQHRAAHMFSELELLKSVVLKALLALDEESAEVPELVSLAKAKTCEVAELVTNEAIQMHGGMGMTDEFDIGLFIKRARALQQLFGDYRYHADRFAHLRGY